LDIVNRKQQPGSPSSPAARSRAVPGGRQKCRRMTTEADKSRLKKNFRGRERRPADEAGRGGVRRRFKGLPAKMMKNDELQKVFRT